MSGGCIGTKVVHLGKVISISSSLFSLRAYWSDSASCLFCSIALGRAAAVFSLMGEIRACLVEFNSLHSQQ